MVRLFQRRFLAEILGVLTVAQALTFLDHAFPGRVVNGVHRLLHMLQPVLLGQVVDVPALRDHAAVLIAAAPGLTHIQRYFILRAVGGRKVKVGGEHTGGHVAKLAAHDVPGAGIQLLSTRFRVNCTTRPAMFSHSSPESPVMPPSQLDFSHSSGMLKAS